ncbi:putative gustatory receptor 57a [Scaptodrosophila lebanonensis]|uniref:Gustatory receptor n=1 Tax=Drosophila lebanonensis TaxID=7225 RepID=A0A6J2ULW5_DROLE|nr:putative gustatory receptor 57a [Scaptodrosophila lebanonensis]
MALLYFFREPETLWECVNFVCGLQFGMCCNGFFQQGKYFVVNKWTRLYSLGLSCAVLTGMCGSIYGLLRDNDLRAFLYKTDKLVLSIVFLELVMSIFVYVVTVASMQSTAHQHLRIYNRLAALDDQLMQEFGANLNYRKLKRKNIMVLATVTVLYVSAVNSVVGRIAGDGNKALVACGGICYIIITGGPHFTGYIHMNIAEMLGIRFRLLQKIINPQFFRWRFVKVQLREQRLRSAMEMVKELHYLITEVNKVYKLSLWTAIAHDFTLTTSELYIIFGRADMDGGMNSLLIAYVATSMLPPFYKMLVAPVYCDRTIRDGRKCLRLLEMLDIWFPGSPVVKQMVTAMLHWRLEFQIEFSSGLGVSLNKKTITLFTTMVFNYLLILIQFSMTQKLSHGVVQQRVTQQDWTGI